MRTGSSELEEIDFSNCTTLTSGGTDVFKMSGNPSGTSVLSTVNFSGCTQLVSLGENFFSTCKAISRIDFSNCNELSTFGKQAFYSVNRIEYLDISGTKLQDSNVFADNTYSIALIKSKGYLTEFKANNCMNISGVSGVLDLSGYEKLKIIELSGCTSLTSVSAPDSVVKLDLSNTNLSSLDLNGKANLTELYIPSTVNTLTNVPDNSNLIIYYDGTEEEWIQHGLDKNVPSSVLVIWIKSPIELRLIAPNNKSLEYDGKDKSAELATEVRVEGLDLRFYSYSDIKLTSTQGEEGSEQTVAPIKAGNYTITPTSLKVTDLSGRDVSKKFRVNGVSGSLTITQKPITITTGSAVKGYDGTPLTDHTYTISGALAEGDAFDHIEEAFSKSQTVVGSVDNAIDLTKVVIKNTDKEIGDVSASYNLTIQSGTLQVNQTIKLSKVFDDKPAESFGFVVTVMLDGQPYTVKNYIDYGETEKRDDYYSEEGRHSLSILASADGHGEARVMVPAGGEVTIGESVDLYHFEVPSFQVGAEQPVQATSCVLHSIRDSETSVTCTNTKIPICRIKETAVQFTSLTAAVEAAKSGQTIEMLLNYTMQADDAVVIPEGKTICFTTAEEFAPEQGSASAIAVISRGNTLSGPIFTVDGGLTLSGITLDGKDIQVESPVIQVNKEIAIAADATIQNGNSSSSGGAVRVASGASMSMSGGTIQNNKAELGAGIFVAGRLNMSGGTVTGNTAADSIGGAIDVADESSRLYFSGSAKVIDNNTNAAGSQRNVVLSVDSNEVINAGTETEVLTSGAEIGVFVPDTVIGETTLYILHGISTKPFAKINNSDDNNKLDCFVNDRNTSFHGNIGEKDTAGCVIWTAEICKVLDKDGNPVRDSSGKERVFNTIKSAVEYICDNLTDKTGKVAMLMDYIIPESDHVEIPNGASITLTTAAISDNPDVRGYVPSVPGSTQATIERKSTNVGSFITVNGSSSSYAAFSLHNIILDGAGIATTSISGGAINASYADITINDSIIRNFSANEGGAVMTEHTTFVTVTGSEFSNCKSLIDQDERGGGAIRTDARTLTIENTSFTACTAVRQAGAVYHRGSGTSTTVTGCKFTECKTVTTPRNTASAGAMETDSKSVSVTGTTFNHCVSTRGAGALNIYSLRNDKNGDCTAIIENCHFYGCSGSDKVTTEDAFSGGALKSIAHDTTVKNCEFKDYTDASGAVFQTGCSFGGAIGLCNINGSGIATIEACTFENCRSSVSGGAVYSKVKSLTLCGNTDKGLSITNCSADDLGGAIIVQAGASVTFSSGCSITGNSSKNGGAVDVAAASCTLKFSGNPTIYDNYESGSTTQQKNVVLRFDSNAIINTVSGTALSEDAKIGVYVTDDSAETETVYDRHGLVSKPFGTWTNDTDHLEGFINDRDDVLFGMQRTAEGKKEIYWDAHVCKITNAGGDTLRIVKDGQSAPAVYLYSDVLGSLQHAFTDYTSGEFVAPAGKTDNIPACIKMIVKRYDFQDAETGSLSVTNSLTLTTAGKGEEEEYPYQGQDGTVSLINRGKNTSSLITVNMEDNDARLILNNITLDGGNKTGDTPFLLDGDGGLVNVQKGSLRVQKDTTLQNSTVNGYGGAIYVNNGCKYHMIDGSINGNKAEKGGGVYAKGTESQADPDNITVNIQGGKISDNIATNDGGGVFIDQGRNVSITNNTVLSGNKALGETNEPLNGDKRTRTDIHPGVGGAIYVDRYSVLTVENSTISENEAYTAGGGIYVYASNYLLGKLTLKNVDVINNTAACGGGIGGINMCHIYIDGSEISGNRAVTRDNPPEGSQKVYHNGCGGGIGLQSFSCDHETADDSRSILEVRGGLIGSNTADNNGGGVYLGAGDSSPDGGTRHCILDGTKVAGNTASAGGGGYAGRITMRNDVEVSGNRLTNSNNKNGAGFYVSNKLTLGREGSDSENTVITDNTTAEGRPSNLSLKLTSATTGKPAHNNEDNIELLCPFQGRILVSNPGDYDTQFGIEKGSDYLDDTISTKWEDAKFASDDDTDMIGIVKDADKLYWYKEPICKITADGKLLYKDPN